MLHEEILNSAQKELLPLLGTLRKDYGLVGGTAIALHIGHRKSIDFDLFSCEKIDRKVLRKEISDFKNDLHVFVDTEDEYTVLVGGVKVTFLRYPFGIEFPISFGDTARLPDLLTLASMKAYALGRRAKWKDYVDLFYIMKDRHSLVEIVGKASAIFGGEFNEKIFRTQLAYFKDIDYSEKIIWVSGFEMEEEEIKNILTQISLS
ncbi:MAG: hypothetical protein A3J06_01085 [Candidatus Moranbacteria bacterium RIFCSPLOWO2_02_FULL_48_19]|nr:MAG: hypothetical protein A3J06_01085 [Candidatus Moranbacteria bacterium RIFCSPLOWO2_02_FULL_48_19]OGI30310.1 MAG: hypothetical protein A3G09_02250 [Candidatus Moranbacteria bacterium RIFCSPLOWO2_12_FULL_48_12]